MLQHPSGEYSIVLHEQVPRRKRKWNLANNRTQLTISLLWFGKTALRSVGRCIRKQHQGAHLMWRNWRRIRTWTAAKGHRKEGRIRWYRLSVLHRWRRMISGWKTQIWTLERQQTNVADLLVSHTYYREWSGWKGNGLANDARCKHGKSIATLILKIFWQMLSPEKHIFVYPPPHHRFIQTAIEHLHQALEMCYATASTFHRNTFKHKNTEIRASNVTAPKSIALPVLCT